MWVLGAIESLVLIPSVEAEGPLSFSPLISKLLVIIEADSSGSL